MLKSYWKKNEIQVNFDRKKSQNILRNLKYFSIFYYCKTGFKGDSHEDNAKNRKTSEF